MTFAIVHAAKRAMRSSKRSIAWEARDLKAYNDTPFASTSDEAEKRAYARILGTGTFAMPDPDIVPESEGKPRKAILADMEKIVHYHSRFRGDLLLNPRGKEALTAARNAVEKILETPSPLSEALKEQYGDRVQRLREELVKTSKTTLRR